MSLFKRREFSLEVKGELLHHFQAEDIEAAQTKATALASKHGISKWKLHQDPEATYSMEIQHKGKRYLRDTGFRDLRSAAKFETTFRDGLNHNRLEVVRGLTARAPANEVTLGTILEKFEAFAKTEGFAPGTVRGYKNTMKILVRGALGESADFATLPLSQLDAKLVYAYKASIPDQADDARRRQLEGTANSVLRQAKGLFSARACEHYRVVCGLTLPPNLAEFRDSPGFANTLKVDYRLPSDDILKETFTQLATKRETDPDVFMSVWLALGFGLRKSEIGAVRAGWFELQADGDVVLHLKQTIVPTSTKEKAVTKNGMSCPAIVGTNGAWEEIGPLISKLDAQAYVLRADSSTARTEEVFRRVSAWMKNLGWTTQHTMHEWRAYGGCQVAMRDGIEAASRWLRHSSIMITQRHYGHYLKPKVTRGAMAIPKDEPKKEFVPKIVNQ